MAYLTNDKVQEAIADGYVPHVIDTNSLACYKVSEFGSLGRISVSGSEEAVCRLADHILSRPLERKYMRRFSDLWILVVEKRRLGEDINAFWKGALSNEQHAFYEKNGKMVVAYMLISEDEDENAKGDENVRYIEWQDSIVRGFGLAAKLVYKVEKKLSTYKDIECKDVSLHPREIIFPAAGYHLKHEIESVFDFMHIPEDYPPDTVEGLIMFFVREYGLNPIQIDWVELEAWMEWILSWQDVLDDDEISDSEYPYPYPQPFGRPSIRRLFKKYAAGSFQTPEDITRFVERALDKLPRVYEIFGVDAPVQEICEIVRRNTAEHVQAFHTEYCVDVNIKQNL